MVQDVRIKAETGRALLTSSRKAPHLRGLPITFAALPWFNRLRFKCKYMLLALYPLISTPVQSLLHHVILDCTGGHDVDEADIKVRLAAASIYTRLLAARSRAAPIRAFRADPGPEFLDPDTQS